MLPAFDQEGYWATAKVDPWFNAIKRLASSYKLAQRKRANTERLSLSAVELTFEDAKL